MNSEIINVVVSVYGTELVNKTGVCVLSVIKRVEAFPLEAYQN